MRRRAFLRGTAAALLALWMPAWRLDEATEATEAWEPNWESIRDGKDAYEVVWHGPLLTGVYGA